MKAFLPVEQVLINAPILAYQRSKGTFVLDTEANNVSKVPMEISKTYIQHTQLSLMAYLGMQSTDLCIACVLPNQLPAESWLSWSYKLVHIYK